MIIRHLCHARSPLQVVQEKSLPVIQENLKTFNAGQAFGASIWLEIWGIHVAGNRIVRVAMFLCHARSPLPVNKEKPLHVVQEMIKTFNVRQAYGASIWPGIWGIHLALN